MALCFIALSLWSCKKDETKTVAVPGADGTLKSSVSTVVLDKTTLTANVVTFNVSEGSFGYNAAVSNVLQVALKGTNFATVKEALLDVRPTTKSFTGLELNNLLLSLGLPTTSNSDVEIRVKSTISASFTPIYSNVVTMSVRPFPLTSWVYVVGQFNSWSEVTPDSLVSPLGNGVYTGIVNFPATDANFQFKIITVKGSWAVNYGDGGDQKLALGSSTNLNAVTSGTKLITVDMNQKTWLVENAKVWSIIGNAVPGSDWVVDKNLKPINDGKGTWTIKTDLAVGEFKFRLDGKWETAIGNAGGNIAVTTAGNYTITLTVNADGLTGTYTLVKN